MKAGNPLWKSRFFKKFYRTPVNSNYNFLMIDSSGLVQEGDFEMLRESIYRESPDTEVNCYEGAPIQSPYWNNGINKIYSSCPQVNVGIGTEVPYYSLDVRGDGYFQDNIGIGMAPHPSIQIVSSTNKQIGFSVNHTYSGNYGYALKAIINKDLTKGLGIYNQTFGKDIFTVYGNGKIEVSNASGKILQLDANGLLRGRQIKLDLDNWADFVFEEGYELMPLSEVEKFIRNKKHLPNVLSEKELIVEGLDLEEMNKTLMMKVEELTLYLIEQDKAIKEMQLKIKELESQNQ